MLELYERVPKSNEFVKGSRKIEENENFILNKPTLLCLAAQYGNPKSVFGLTKFGMRVTGLRTRNEYEQGYDLESFPVAFCSAKSDKPTIDFNEFYENYLKSLIVKEDKKISPLEAAKNLRNLNILSYCDGTTSAVNIVKTLKSEMKKAEYDDKEIDYAISQIGLISLSTDIDTSDLGCTVVDFHDINDQEVGNDRIRNTAFENYTEKEGIGVENGQRRAEILIKGSGEHYVKEYMEEGKATPACLRKVIGNLLTSSVSTAKGKFEPLTIDRAVEGCKEIQEEAREGKNKEELLEKVGNTVKYEGAKRITPREAALMDELDSKYDEQITMRSKIKVLEAKDEKNEKRISDVIEVAKEECKAGTALKIIKATGYQISKEGEEFLQSNPQTDKDIIESQRGEINKLKEEIRREQINSETNKQLIQEQEGKIARLQSMLKKTLEFADNVRQSVFGKVFFGKSIKRLTEGNTRNDEEDFER